MFTIQSHNTGKAYRAPETTVVMISMEKGVLTLSGGIDTVTEENWSWDVLNVDSFSTLL